MQHMLAAVRNSIASAILQSARTASRGAVRLTRAPLQTRPLCTASSALNVAQDSTVQDTAAPAAKPRKLRRIGRTIGKTVLLTTGIGAAASLYSLQKGFGGWYNTWDAGARFFRTMYNGAVITLDYKLIEWRYRNDTNEEYLNAMKEAHKRTAQRIYNVCIKSGGLYVKIGQYIAAQNHTAPKEYIETLKPLQDQATWRDFLDMQEVFVEDFGATPHEIFASFDRKPLAAASIAQVHRAVTKDGREVAVKIQYPEIQRRFKVDMFTHQVVLELLAFFFPKLDLRWTGDEMRSVLEQELDFISEAKNAERAFANFKGNPDVYIPKVYWDLTSKRVLTTEFIHGVKVTDLAGLERLGITRKDAASKVLNVLAEQVFESGFIHGDPHPGNVFVRINPTKPSRGCQVVLLDHGLYKELPEKLRLQFCRLYKSLVLNQLDEAKNVALEMGVKNWRMFAFMILMRPLDASDLFDESLTSEQRKELLSSKDKFFAYMHQHFQKKQEEMIEMMRTMPTDLLLVLRNNNLIRSLNHDLGVPVNRFTIFARHSLKGLRNSPWSSSSWKDRFYFEYTMLSWEIKYWIEGVVLKVLQWLGFVSKEFSQEGTSMDSSDAVPVESLPLKVDQL